MQHKQKCRIQSPTNSAASMISRYRGFIALLKAENPHVLTIHCVIHRQHLVAKNMSGRLNLSLKTVNKIKTHALNTRSDLNNSAMKMI